MFKTFYVVFIFDNLKNECINVFIHYIIFQSGHLIEISEVRLLDILQITNIKQSQ